MTNWDSGYRVSPYSPFVFYTLRDDETHAIQGQVISSEGGGKIIFSAFNNFRGHGKGQHLDELGNFETLEAAKAAVESGGST